jgi:hypothetical protein
MPEVGIFISRDSWSGNHRKPITLNGYGYADGNSINLRDPSGFCSTSWNDSEGLFTKEACDRMDAGDLEFTKKWFYEYAAFLEKNGLHQAADNFRTFLVTIQAKSLVENTNRILIKNKC